MSFESRFKKPETFQTKLFINNKFVDGVNKTFIPVINPATEEKICDIAEATEQDVELAIDAAQAAYPGWKATSLTQRSMLLTKLADLI